MADLLYRHGPRLQFPFIHVGPTVGKGQPSLSAVLWIGNLLTMGHSESETLTRERGFPFSTVLVFV